MGINPQDPRVRKTRKGLQDALIRLILRQGYDDISIQDIATEAETARITFYRHYRDKQELLSDCMNVLYDDLSRRTEGLTRDALAAGVSPVEVLYQHISEHEALYRILFASGAANTVLGRMRHHMAAHALDTLSASARTPVGDVPPEIVAYHAASAQLGLAMWWLNNNKPYSASYMARLSLWLTLCGLFEALGINDVSLARPEVS